MDTTDISKLHRSPVVPPWTLGWRLNRALSWADMTTADMAAELEVSRSVVSRWLNDHGKAPKSLYVKLWAIRCGVPYEWLSTGEMVTSDPNGGGDVRNPSSAWNDAVLAAESGKVLQFHQPPAAA